MKRTGLAELPLHYGRCPRALFVKMKTLGKLICEFIIEEYGVNELLKRFSNPVFFQALGCVLGYDYHSSGLTTTVCAALKEALDPVEHGVALVGGKGRASVKAKDEIEDLCLTYGLSTYKIKYLMSMSGLTAKIDNSVLQDGYKLYHHVMVISEKGDWVVIQQGMNTLVKKARRYHWFSPAIRDPVEEPHSGIITQLRENVVLDLTSRNSRECRNSCIELVNENMRTLKKLVAEADRTLKGEKSIMGDNLPIPKFKFPSFLVMPKKINWDALMKAYELSVGSFRGLLEIKGMGASTIRALALTSALIFGCPLSWKDPAKFSFAHGGKDGVPFPLNYKTYNETIRFFENLLRNMEIDSGIREKKLRILKELSTLVQ